MSSELGRVEQTRIRPSWRRFEGFDVVGHPVVEEAAFAVVAGAVAAAEADRHVARLGEVDDGSLGGVHSFDGIEGGGDTGSTARVEWNLRPAG